MLKTGKIGFGGSCHWCTEAIFQSLKGVINVSQGWIKPDDIFSDFSEAVIVEFDPALISLASLIEIHLHTHSCTSEHAMRSKYRSAVYTFNDDEVIPAKQAIEMLQKEFEQTIITKVIPFKAFKLNDEQYLDYYYKNPEKPFCKTFIDPKLKILLNRFSSHVDELRLPKLLIPVIPLSTDFFLPRYIAALPAIRPIYICAPILGNTEI